MISSRTCWYQEGGSTISQEIWLGTFLMLAPIARVQHNSLQDYKIKLCNPQSLHNLGREPTSNHFSKQIHTISNVTVIFKLTCNHCNQEKYNKHPRKHSHSKCGPWILLCKRDYRIKVFVNIFVFRHQFGLL